MSRSAFARVGALVALLLPSAALAGPVTFGKYDVPSVFHLAKSENKNQVHYGARLDDRCAFVKDAPVTAYWRDREVSETATSHLIVFEKPAYGVDVITRVDDHHLRIALRALPERPIELFAERGPDGACTASAVTKVGGEAAVLDEIFAQLSGWSVEYVILHAARARDGVSVKERIVP